MPALARLKAATEAALACDGYVAQRSDQKLGDIAKKTLGDRPRWPG